jgi:hypothetical protein
MRLKQRLALALIGDPAEEIRDFKRVFIETILPSSASAWLVAGLAGGSSPIASAVLVSSLFLISWAVACFFVMAFGRGLDRIGRRWLEDRGELSIPGLIAIVVLIAVFAALLPTVAFFIDQMLPNLGATEQMLARLIPFAMVAAILGSIFTLGRD